MAWFPGAIRLAWIGTRPAAVVVYERGHAAEPPLPLTQTVALTSAPGWGTLAAVDVPIDVSGCAIEDIAASATGRWAVTHRSSGQGECGFDVIDLRSMVRVGGLSDIDGYMLELPVFSEDESRVVAGWGPWLGGWWAHPDDEVDEPARGGVIDFGCVAELALDTHELRRCRLELDIPPGWLPDDPWSDRWSGPTGLRPAGRGVRMVLPGGEVLEHPEPLPDVLRLPFARLLPPSDPRRDPDGLPPDATR